MLTPSSVESSCSCRVKCYGLTNEYKKLESRDMLLKNFFGGFVMSSVLVGRSAIPETNLFHGIRRGRIGTHLHSR